MKSDIFISLFRGAYPDLAGAEFSRCLDLSDNGHVIELDGDEYYFLMRARVDRTFDAREAIFQINDWLEARSYMWLFAVDFEMKSSSDLEGFFVFEVQPNQGSDMRRCVFPSLLSNRLFGNSINIRRALFPGNTPLAETVHVIIPAVS